MWPRASPCSLSQTPVFRGLFPPVKWGSGLLGWGDVATSSAPASRRHHLCRSRHYCRTAGDRVETLYARLEQLVQQASQQADSSVALYHFNASLYLLRVLRGSTVDKPAHKAQKKEKASKDASSQPQGPEVSRPGPGRLGLEAQHR